MKNRIGFGIAITAILVVGSIAMNVFANRSNESVTLDYNQVPIVNSPLDIVYIEGSTGHSIVWQISDDDPGYYVTFRDGVLLDAVSWELNNETVTVDIDGLSAGNYEYMILISDSLINVTDYVIVTVLVSDIEVHAPFSISSNTDFNDTAQAEGWMGNGSISNPFIIGKLYINASYDCISIHGTDVHFIIQDCAFVKEGTDSGIGLDLQGVSNGIIESCTFTNLWIGCITWFTSNCTWNGNWFSNVMDGLWLQESQDCTITNNEFYSGGISFAGYDKLNWIHEVSGNTVQEKPLGYFQGIVTQDIDANNYGQIIIANCSDVIARNGWFTDVGIPISIGYSNSSGADNCIINGGRTGIFVERSFDTELSSCEIYGSSEVGLYINESMQTAIETCTIKNIGWVGAQIGMAWNTSVIGCTFRGCGDTAIAIYESPDFILLDSVIDYNNNGLTMGGCTDSDIINNSFQWNSQYGIQIWWDSDGSYFYDNVIGYNSLGNANDDGTGTFWDDGISLGNLWSDFSGSGYYYVPGSRGGIDHYPGGYSEDHLIEILDLTDDISYALGRTGHKIIWYPNCTHPLQYSIYKDGMLVKNQAWDGSIIEYNVDGLPLGIYNFTLVIMDTFNQTASDSVQVYVYPDTTMPGGPTNTSTNTNTGGFEQITLFVSIGSTVVIIIVVILMLRTKKNM